MALEAPAQVAPRDLLLSRLRSVTFAALSAGVTEEEVQEAFAVAVKAEERRRAAAEIPTQRPPLRLVAADTRTDR